MTLASEANHWHIVELLLEKGADPNIQDVMFYIMALT